MTAAVLPETRGPALRDRLGLAVLVALLVACAWLLHLIGGWPHLPAGLPSWRILTITLQGSYVPDQAAVYLITTLGWLAWLGVHLMFLVGFRNRAVVLLNWSWNYLTWDRASRVILDED